MAKSAGGRIAGGWSRVAMALLLGWSTAVSPLLTPAMAQPATSGPPGAGTSTTPPPDVPPPAAPGASSGQTEPQEKPYTLSDLAYLLGPIALYPDTLLALILPASTVPLDVVHAQRWLDANAEAAKRGDFSGVDATQWEAPVQALTRFPDIIRMLGDNLEWTESLGMAFSMQPDDVTTAIQMLRAEAYKQGNLASTPQQTVNVQQGSGMPIVNILPANPELIYVPVYDSTTVFTTAVAGAVLFAGGVAVGSYWNDRWGWDERRWRSVAVPRQDWRPPPQWKPYRSRPGVPPREWARRPDTGIYRGGPAGRPPRAGMPPAPGMGPDRVPRPGGFERPSGPSGAPSAVRRSPREQGPAMSRERGGPSARPATSRPAPAYRPSREARQPREMQARQRQSGPPREARQRRPEGRPQPQMRQGSGGRPPPQARQQPNRGQQQQKGRPQPNWKPPGQ